MDWTSIIVAALAVLGSAYGSYKSKDKIMALVEYRLIELEKKQDRHNSLIERVYNLERNCGEFERVTEEKFKVANHRLDDLENKFD